MLAHAVGPPRFAETRQIRIIRADGGRVDPFDLGAFLERGGGTVYVPSPAQSHWRMFFDTLRDIVSVLSILALIGAL